MSTTSITQYREDFLKNFTQNVSNASLLNVAAGLAEKNNRQTLFRYRKLNSYTMEEILKQQVYLAQPQDFDDIFDSRYTIPDLKTYEKAEAAFALSNALKDKNPDMMKNYNDYVAYYSAINNMADERLRIAAFTQTNMNIPMWYYYAKKHKGICIEYDLTDFNSKNLSSPEVILLPVIYPDDKTANTYRCSNYEENHENVMLVRNALVKNKNWNFEKEWRLISVERPDIYQHLKIQAIYFGLKTAEVDKRLILQFNKDYNLGIDIYQMTFNNVKFEAKKII